MEFAIKTDVPYGEYRWLTVVSPERPKGVELLLEPNAHPAANESQRAIVADRVPWTSFVVNDVRAEYERIGDAGVEFVQPPAPMGPVMTAVFDDTCGNLIKLTEMTTESSGARP